MLILESHIDVPTNHGGDMRTLRSRASDLYESWSILISHG